MILIRMADFWENIGIGDLVVTGCKAVKRIRSSSSLPNGVKKNMDLTGIWELSSRAWQTLLDVKNLKRTLGKYEIRYFSLQKMLSFHCFF